MSLTGQSAGGPKQDLKKPSLDKDLTKIVHVEEATRYLSTRLTALGMVILFLAAAGALASVYADAQSSAVMIVVASMLGGYMALNIGANDVANNVGPAVGSRA